MTPTVFNILFLSPIILNFYANNCLLYEERNKQKIVLSENHEVKRTKKILYKEVCESGKYTMCDGGYDVPFRSYPLLINLNHLELDKCYDTVYVFLTPPVISSLKASGQPYMMPWEMDSILNSQSDLKIDTINFKVPKKFYKRVCTEIKRNKLKVEFDGYLNYAPFFLDFSFIDGGIMEIAIPDIKSETKGVFKYQKSHMFFITQIHSIGSGSNYHLKEK